MPGKRGGTKPAGRLKVDKGYAAIAKQHGGVFVKGEGYKFKTKKANAAALRAHIEAGGKKRGSASEARRSVGLDDDNS